MRRALTTAWLTVALGATGSAQDGEPARAGTAATEQPDLARAWLVDLLDTDPIASLDSYLAVARHPDSPRDDRLRAWHRVLQLADIGQREALATEATAAIEHLLGSSLPTAERRRAVRLAEAGQALAALLSQQPNATTDDLLAWARRNHPRLLEGRVNRLRGEGAAAPDDLAEYLSRLLREAEERGDVDGANRLRQLIRAREDDAAHSGSPRARQIRRWAAEMVRWELRGETDKVDRMARVLGSSLRSGRLPTVAERMQQAKPPALVASLRRLQQILMSPQRQRVGLSARELDLLDEAVERIDAARAQGDLGTMRRLLAPSYLLLRGTG